MLKRITQSSYLHLMSGIVLFFTAGYETITTFKEASIGSHHGVLFFAVVQIVKVIPEIVHGSKEFEEAKELTK
ncbi:MAG: hypothetical protein PHV05_07890 [Candidatus Riflebacteria bacterium]|nr:hypothetical protein [Candidatus Riflebacteria bacterium]